MKIKIGRREFDVTERDIIFYNGACYQLTSQTYREGWHQLFPVMSNTQAKKLIKTGALLLLDEYLRYTTSDGKEMWYRRYKFDLEKLHEVYS